MTEETKTVSRASRASETRELRRHSVSRGLHRPCWMRRLPQMGLSIGGFALRLVVLMTARILVQS